MTFRFANQISLFQKVLDIQNGQTLLNFVDALATELNFATANEIIAKLFLSNKSKLSDESIKRLINVINTSNHYPKSDKSMNSRKKCNLEQLPNGVFESIGSYLDIKSSLILSSCNRGIHKMVLNCSYFNAKYPCTKSLTLTSDKLNQICKHNSILDYYLPSCQTLKISNQTRDNSTKIDCTAAESNGNINCALRHFFDSNCNDIDYDQEWMNILLSKICDLSVDNNWICAFNHIPFDKLLCIDTERLKSDNNNDHAEIEEIRITAGDDDLIESQSMKIFGDKFDQFFQNQQKLESRIGNIDIRKMDFGYDYDASNLWTFLEKLHSNYNRITFALPPYSDNPPRLHNCQHFIKLFHHNVSKLELNFYDMNNINDDNWNISQSIFVDSALIIKDLIKSDDILSFKSLLTKYNIDINKLPCIKFLHVNFERWSEDYKSFEKLLQCRKLVQLFNLKSSVEALCIIQYHQINVEYTEKCLNEWGKEYFDKLSHVRIVLYERNREYLKQENVYKEILVRIIATCLRNFSKIEFCGIDWCNQGGGVNASTFSIDIDDNDQILSKNKFETILMPKIVAACQRCFETNCYNRVKYSTDVFHIKRRYQI